MKSKLYSGLVKVLGPVVRFIFRLHYHGLENEPSVEDGPYIMICNHISNADPVFLCAAGTKQQPHYMAKKELFKVPLLNTYAMFTDGVHRVSFDKVVEVMKKTGHDLPSLYKETSEGGLAHNYKQMWGNEESSMFL